MAADRYAVGGTEQQREATGSLQAHQTPCASHLLQTARKSSDHVVGWFARLYVTVIFILPTNITMTSKRGTENLTRRPVTVATVATALPCMACR